MQKNEISLKIVPETGETEEFTFKGDLIGRSFREYVDREYRKKTVEVYDTDKALHLIYVHYRKEGGGVGLADFVRVEKLNLGKIRRALKEAGVYPGIMYGEAIHHARETLKLLESRLWEGGNRRDQVIENSHSRPTTEVGKRINN